MNTEKKKEGGIKPHYSRSDRFVNKPVPAAEHHIFSFKIQQSKFFLFIGAGTQLYGGSPFVAGVSTVLQTPIVEDKENLIPDDSMEWLNRNDNYVPVRVTGYSRTTTSDHSICVNGPAINSTVTYQGGLLLRFHALYFTLRIFIYRVLICNHERILLHIQLQMGVQVVIGSKRGGRDTTI